MYSSVALARRPAPGLGNHIAIRYISQDRADFRAWRPVLMIPRRRIAPNQSYPCWTYQQLPRRCADITKLDVRPHEKN